MKIFLDTNIFLDLIFKREDYNEAVLIFNAIEKQIFEGFVLDITLLNIDYVAKKQVKDIRAFLSLINKNMSVIGANNEIIDEALHLDNNDLEDNVQYISAKNIGCTLIVSNDKNFYSQNVEKYNSVEFVEKYIK